MASEHESVDLVADDTVKNVSLAVAIAALTAVLAQLSIPLPGNVPFSLQPFGPFLAGLVLGPLWGGFALAVYVLAGVAGAPVFANGGAGLGYVAGPTGGFIVGFVLSAVVIGAVAHRQVQPRPLTALDERFQVLALAAGMAVSYAVATPWFASVQGWSLVRAASFMAPFAATDVVKAAIVVAVVGSVSTLPGR